MGSFVKRLARLALSAPPAGIVITIPFIYNVLKRHPALMVMIHREADDDAPSTAFEDPFKADEPDPNATDALESSLWELRALQKHYHPGVASLAKVFGEAFTKPPYSLEDFLDHTYATVCHLTSHTAACADDMHSCLMQTLSAGSKKSLLWRTPWIRGCLRLRGQG